MAIEFSGECRVAAPRQRVWEALNDPAVLQACIAGCRQLDKVSDTEFAAIVTAKVGPVSATFRGTVILSELDPPRGYTLTGQGQGGAAGFAKMSAKVSLAEAGDETVLSYTASAEIGGKLASVGSRLMQSVAKKNADDFFSAFARQLGATGEAALDYPTGEPARERVGERDDSLVEGSAAKATPGDRAASRTVASPPIPVPSAPVSAVGSLVRSLAAPVPAWLVIFAWAVGGALGYFVAR